MFLEISNLKTLQKTTKMMCLLSFPFIGHFWGSLGRFWASLGRSWGALGRSWAALGRSWGALGALLAALGPLLGALRPLLERYAKIIKKSMPKMTDLDPPKPPKNELFCGLLPHTRWQIALSEK